MALEINSRRSAYRHGHNMLARQRRRKQIVRVIVSIMILLMLIVVAALIYIWYTGRYQPAPPAPPPSRPKVKVDQPKVVVDETAAVGVSSQLFTNKVPQGKNASLTIKTNPLAACSISVEYNKQASKDSGLVPKKADEYGVVSWAWTVEASRPIGSWPIVVTCANAKKSGVLEVNIEVVPAE